MAQQKRTTSTEITGEPELTEQQRGFKDSVLEGKSLVEAYKLNYNTENMGYGSIRVEASRLRWNPNVALAISLGRSAMMESTNITKDRWMAMVLAAAEDAKRDSNHGANMQGLQMVGKALGYQREQFEAIVSHDPMETLRDAERELGPDIAAAMAKKFGIDWKADEGATKH